mgnify:CR=1 FL=1
MYMDFLNLDFKNDFVFMNDSNGHLTGGGFLLDSEMLKETINGVSENDNSFKQKGGATVLSALKDLGIPSGLLYTQGKINKNNVIRYENSPETIEQGVYERLLELVEPNNKPKHSIKTKRKRENKRKLSRKKSK